MAGLWTRLRLLTDAVMFLGAIALLGFVLYDLLVGGLWSIGNRRVTSFCDSLYSTYRYRMMTPANPPSPDSKMANHPRRTSFYWVQSESNSLMHRFNIFLIAFYVKFGSGTVISIALGELPVFFKGPRHMVSFLLAFALMQAFPGDYFFNWMRNSSFGQTVLYGSCALYKMRKVLFCLLHPQCGLLTGVLLALIALEGNSMLRRFESVRSGKRVQYTFSKLWSALTNRQERQCKIDWMITQWWPAAIAVLLIVLELQLPSDDGLAALFAMVLHAAAISLLLYRFLRQIDYSQPAFTPTVDSHGVTTAALCAAIWLCVIASVDFAEMTRAVHNDYLNLRQLQFPLNQALASMPVEIDMEFFYENL